MDKKTYNNYCEKLANVLGLERLKILSLNQRNSLNNQLNDLLEEHDKNIDTITKEEIIGRYDLVTKHIYPNEFVEMTEDLENKNLKS